MTLPGEPFDPFDGTPFDLVVLGSGYAGWAAALAARRDHRRVLLVGERGDLVWESGRGFTQQLGECDQPFWRDLLAEVQERLPDGTRGPSSEAWLDGAIAEVVATEHLASADIGVLYYAIPVEVGIQGGHLHSVGLATKAGLRTVRAHRWIDASESGLLVRLVDPAAEPRRATSAAIQVHLQRAIWPDAAMVPPGNPTGWPTERRWAMAVSPEDPAWRLSLPSALETLAAALGDGAADATISHLSFEPVPVYGSGRARCLVPPNLVPASPSFADVTVATVADRIGLGVTAVGRLGSLAGLEVSAAPRATTSPPRTVEAEVCVVGAGTGGALAVLAAARAGARVIAIEPATFVGGMGTGGGIHTYSFGVPGGLQAEVDRATRSLMNHYGKGFLGDGPFNPWAKMITLERMVRDAGVDLLLGHQLYDVVTEGDRVVAALVAGPDGPLRVEAAAFVDGTGDGDLCAMAGATTTLGREGDGLPHAYSQSSGRLRDLNGRPRMTVVNYDAGFCDPTDPVDLTRARLAGIRQYLLPRYENLGRPTYLAPAIGLRQGRQVVTDHVLSLDDQVSWRRFDDRIGFTASHYENHASDCEFESDEAMFWVWANRQWSTPIGCDLPYRMLVPQGLSNVWIASRCAGVSQDAHHATRMQRDVQRLGEAAGFAAAVAVRTASRAAEVDRDALLRLLAGTGALDRRPQRVEAGFGRIGSHDDRAHGPGAGSGVNGLATALALLDEGRFGAGPWWLARHRDLAHDQVTARLDAPQPVVSWLAAGVVAMWGDAAAEPRLVRAVLTREYGFGDGWAWSPGGYNAPRAGDPADPAAWKYVVPNWLCAVGMLRLCGTGACLDALEDLAGRPVHGLNTITTMAITLERLVIGERLAADAVPRVAHLADLLEATSVVGARDNPRRWTGRHSQTALDGTAGASPPAGAPTTPADNAVVDNSWQVPLALARLRRALGQPPPASAVRHLADEQLLVRRAFAAALTSIDSPDRPTPIA